MLCNAVLETVEHFNYWVFFWYGWRSWYRLVTNIYIYIFFFDLKYFQNFIELKKIIVHHLEQFVQENRDSLLTKQRSYQCLEHIYLRGEPIYWLADEHGRISLDENYENQTRNHTPQQRLKKVGERSFTKHLWESMSHSPKQILVTNIY